jgi:hypothetical protein
MSDKCKKCAFVEKFVSETDSATVLYICTAEKPEIEFDGGQKYFEVSELNSADCLYFKDAG